MDLLPQIKFQLVFDEKIDGLEIKELRERRKDEFRDEMIEDQTEDYEGDRGNIDIDEDEDDESEAVDDVIE